MILTEKTLEKYAETVVSRFFNEKVALNDGVTDIAQTENLNEEQIKRLVEAVNTAAFLKKFNNPEPDANGRVVEFETANPNAVLGRMLDNARETFDQVPEGAEDAAAPMSADTFTDMLDLPVTRPDEAPLPRVEEGPPKLGEARINKYVVVRRLQKTAELLKEQEWQARNSFTEVTQQLVDHFRRHDGFEIFEKDAFYQHGPTAVPYLRLLRGGLGKEPAEYDYTDMRKHARVIDTHTPAMHLLRDMMSASQAARDCKQGQEKVSEHLAQLA